MSIDAFLKFEGGDITIEGESLKKGHIGELEILSYSLGAANSGSRHTGKGGGTGRGDVTDAFFSMYTDKSGPALFMASVLGYHIEKATLYVRKAGGDDPVTFVEIELSDVLVSSYQTGGSDGSERSMDSLALNFAKIQFIYRPQKDDGTADADVTIGIDVSAGEKM